MHGKKNKYGRILNLRYTSAKTFISHFPFNELYATSRTLIEAIYLPYLLLLAKYGSHNIGYRIDNIWEYSVIDKNVY